MTVAKDFGFDDVERDRKLGGQIALAFFVLGAPASFLVGCLGDSYNRTYLFAWTVGIGEGACLATFFCQTFKQLYICRAITGFSIGGALPLIYSILGDMFVAEERHKVSAVVGIGTGAGISLGQGVAGFLGPKFGWRLPFAVIGIPALICAALVLLTVDDPERGMMEEAVREHNQGAHKRNDQQETSADSSMEMAPLDQNVDRLDGVALQTEGYVNMEESPNLNIRAQLATFLSVLSTPTVILTMLQGAPGCVPWSIVNTYLNDFLSQDRGMTVEYATFTVLIFGIGNFFGLLLAGLCGSRLYTLDKRYPSIFAGIMAIVGCFPFWALLNGIDNSTPFPVLATVAILAGLSSAATGPIVKATLQNVTLPNTRGQAFALFTTFDDFGRGLGPVFVAKLISSMGGRAPAFNIGVIGWMICGFFNLCMFFTVARDERYVQATLTARFARQQECNLQQEGVSIAEHDTAAGGIVGNITQGTSITRRSITSLNTQR